MDRIQIKKRLTFWYTFFWILFLVALYLSYFVYFVDFSSTKSKWIAFFAGAIGILFSSLKLLELNYFNKKHETFDKITKYFTNNSFIFSKKIFTASIIFSIIISSLLFKTMGLYYVISFISGSFFSSITVMLSTFFVSKSAVQISKFCDESNSFILKNVLNTGIIKTFFSLSLAIIPLVVLYHITKDYQILNGFAFGCVFSSLINNISISTTKQATSDANNVISTYVAQIEKKDKRNPLLLLDGLSKNILSANIFTNEMFSSFVIAIICAMTIGGEFLLLMGAFLPLIISGSAIFVTILVAIYLSSNKLQNPIKTFFSSLILGNFAFILINIFIIKTWYPDSMRLLIPIIVGSLIGTFICFINSNNIFSKYMPSINISNSSTSGFIAVLKQIMRECFGGIIFPAFAIIILIIASFLGSYGLQEPSYGVYGVSLAILSAILMASIISIIANFASIICSSKDILISYKEDVSEQSYEPNKFIFDLSQNILALNKNFINFSSILVSIGTLISYSVLINLIEADILNPYVMSALILGATIPFTYCALTMGIITKTARRLVLEVKRQFKKFPQILRFEMCPDYEKCIEISAINSSIQIVFNSAIIVIIFALIAIFLKIEALLGFVFGAILSTFGIIYISLFTSNVSKSAKKYFESQFGIAQEREEYQALDSNNNIFNSFESFIVPSLCSLIKFLAILALTFIPLFTKGAM